MKPRGQLKLKLVTHNLGGGIKRYRGSIEAMPMEQLQAMIELISKLDADVLCLQEVAQYIDADGKLHSMVDTIQKAGNFPTYLYGETLSMKKHMQVKKDTMVDGLFMDWWDWSKGNAVFSKTPFSRLGDTSKEGVPRNVPIFQPSAYEGSRDSDPRYAILGRLKREPYPFFVNLHLTTLVGERPPNVWKDVIDAARLTRYHQLGRILDLVQRNIIDKEEPLILMGDFNATPEEYNVKEYLEKECGFIRLAPKNAIATHAVAGMVDHIFFSPAERLIDYECWIEDSKLTRQVSDHLPVIAEITIL
ncbi:MAG: endonuclease/exonuclease/phosphatase family protein [Anaerolineaceae bacterium]|nr:endonuclease/exonuclease/phosphatase family protein [Anaerolineaceae bacterium]